MKITDEERALLTDAELAGLEEGEEFDEGEGQDGAEAGATDADAGGKDAAAASGQEADDAGEGEGEGESTGQGNADDAAAEAAAAAAATAAAAGDAGKDAATDDELDTFTNVKPLAVAKLPEDFDDKVKAIEDGKSELGTKLNEGEIDMVEYHAQLDKLNKQERELERVKDGVEASERQRYATWTGVHVNALFERHPEYRKNERLTGMLDQEVKKLQASDGYSSDTDPKILIDAHKNLAEAFPGVFKAAAKAAAPAKKEPVKHASAPSLAKVPAADTDQPGEHEFSHLDSLLERDPSAYERELEKLARTNPAKYDAYLAQ